MYQIYLAEGYLPQQAIEEIFTHNLVGVDLDTRAKQLSMFALLLKACQRDNSFADAHCLPLVLDMPEPWSNKQALGQALNDCFRGVETAAKREQLLNAFQLLEQAENLGSIMQFDMSDSTRLMIQQTVNYWKQQSTIPDNVARLLHSLQLILVLTNKYAAICMNPPYMGSRNMNAELSKYVKDHYEKGKADLCTVFMLMQSHIAAKGGYYANIVPPSWLFLPTFEELRKSIIGTQTIHSLLHLSRGVFGADFGSASCVIQNQEISEFKGTYFRLIERTFQEFDQQHLKLLFEKTLANHEFRYLFANYTKEVEDIEYSATGAKIYYPNISQKNFEKIPGCPIGYWVSEKMLKIYENDTISNNAEVITGMTTGDNKKYLRLWSEVNYQKCSIGESEMRNVNLDYRYWIPYSKGGTRRNWYGNYDYVVNWSKREYFNRAKTTLQHLYLKEAVTWPFITSGNFSARLLPTGSLWDVAGSPCFFYNQELEKYTLAFLCTKLCNIVLKISNPTINVQALDIKRLPLIIKNKEEIANISDANISISKQDWDAHETSWDFEANPLVALRNRFITEGDSQTSFTLSALVHEFKTLWEDRFNQLHANEEELNRQFIEIYGLQDELTPDVPLEDITILQQGEIAIENNQLVWNDAVLIKQLISYAIGVTVGRYRLDRPGLHIAHPTPTSDELAAYDYCGKSFDIDDDAIIPILPDDSPFADNLCNRLKEFVLVVFGEDMLTANLNFIEQTLGKPINDYLQKDFFDDHNKMYQNLPIYWLFSSKKGAFRCLVYMHRMSRFTVDRVRTKYLLPYIEYLENTIADMESAFADLSTPERRQLDKYRKVLLECKEYHTALHDVASRMIEFDLDDGVLHNYQLFAPVLKKLKNDAKK